MAVNQVHVHSFAILEAEYPAPVAGGTYAPLTPSVALQRMQPEARRIGAIRMCCLLQPEQDAPKPWHQVRWQPSRVVSLMQCPQPLVPDFHEIIVTRNATRRKWYVSIRLVCILFPWILRNEIRFPGPSGVGRAIRTV